MGISTDTTLFKGGGPIRQTWSQWMSKLEHGLSPLMQESL